MAQNTRERSLWAWGWADKFPDHTARAGLVQLGKALIPTASPVLRELPHDPAGTPSSDSYAVAAPRAPIPDALVDFATQSPRERAMRTRGRAFPDLVAGFTGAFAGAPDLVARPRTDEEVLRVLEVANERGWAVVPFGGGTSVVGGVDSAAARDGGRAGVWGDDSRVWSGASREVRTADVVVSLDMGAIDGVRELDTESRLARIGAGALGPALEDGLARHGLTLRHYPQSFEFSTLGGWLATRAGGHYATGPTRIDELCHSLTLVTPRGALATHRHPGSGAGPEANRLVFGSEGALGVITEAWMRVVPRPRWRASASIAYRDFERGVGAARALAQSGLLPSNARLLDANEARLHRVRFDGSHVLLVGFESADHPLDAWMARALELAKDYGGEVVSGPIHKDDGDKARSGGDADKWRQAFFDAPYLQSALLSIGVLSDTFETACTWSQFPAMHARIVGDVQRALEAECGGGIVSCRFTHVYPDGPAPYYTFIGALRPGAELVQWRAIKAAASDALAATGGTITHHHAVGRTHRPWYERERPALFGDALLAVKRELDPNGVMNPGVLLA
ncbi:MAG: FAD-binding oxidoreductase [Kofleriaceae bacterium]